VETGGAHAAGQRFTLSLSRRTPSRKAHHRGTQHRETFHRKTPKITLAAPGSALALAAIAAAAIAAWPGHTPAAAAQAAAARRRQPPATPAATARPVTASGSPQQMAQGLLGSYGWSSSQFSCLRPLWNAESGWNASASNPSSGAYGIPQALPGTKMASAGPDWQTSAATQIRWGLGYIRSVYGSPCAAWSHEQAYGWY
jgi:hypothetical protein